MTKTKDIINLSRIGMRDGGSQNACSFLKELSYNSNVKDYCVVAFEESETGILSRKLGFETMLIPRKPLDRLRLDWCCRNLFKKGQLCFTFFGSPWYKSQDYLVNIAGVADSNLYYPEIDFWKFHPPVQKANKYIKDRGRMFGYSWADHWIFETDSLARRAVDLGGYPEERVSVVKMAASSFVSSENVNNEVKQKFRDAIGESFNLLFLAGANPNKRIASSVPAVAMIKKQQVTDVNIKVVTTLDPQSDYCNFLRDEFEKHGVGDCWVNLGPVSYSDVPSLIDSCDVICLFSVLESFSNNCTEAWNMDKPLLIADADWSRSACGDAAMYTDPDNSQDVAQAVVSLTDAEVVAELIGKYKSQFATYPTAKEKCLRYLECLETARGAGNVSSASRRSIRKFKCKPISN